MSGCKEDTLCFSFRCRSPRPTPGGVSKGEGPCPRPPSPWGLVSKGGGQGPRPLCRFKGVRGEIEIPPRFSLGGRGDILFSKENIPLASPYRNGTVPPGTPVIFSARRKENGDSIRCGIAAHLRTNLVRLMSQKKMWGAFCAAKPRFLRRTVACLRIIPDQRHTHAPGTAPPPA